MRWLALLFLFACSSKPPAYTNGTIDPPARTDPDPMLPGPGGGTMGQSCRGWECAIVDCGAAPPTMISGVVSDPGESFPIYDALVYVPNQQETPMPDGASCGKQCPADAPVATALTDAQGRFRLANAPAGSKVPLVIQIGKWRRRVEIPVVKACTDNLIDPGLSRLPRNHLEGSIPKIAVATGCDHLECFAASVGVDASEITGPNGGGRIHVYRGHDSGQALPDLPGDADALFSNAKLLQSYDIVLASSECGTFARDITPITTYLQNGGTLLASGNAVGLFATNAKLQTMASFAPAPPEAPPYAIDTTSPQAKALADWAAATKVAPNGTVTLAGAGGRMGAIKSGGTRLVKSATQTQLASFRLNPYFVCGRVGYADFEVSGATVGDGAYPTRCQFLDDVHRTSEALFQPSFFDWTCEWMSNMQPPLGD